MVLTTLTLLLVFLPGCLSLMNLDTLCNWMNECLVEMFMQCQWFGQTQQDICSRQCHNVSVFAVYFWGDSCSRVWNGKTSPPRTFRNYLFIKLFHTKQFYCWALQVGRPTTHIQPKEKHDVVIFKINESKTATKKKSQLVFTVRALQS